MLSTLQQQEQNSNLGTVANLNRYPPSIPVNPDTWALVLPNLPAEFQKKARYPYCLLKSALYDFGPSSIGSCISVVFKSGSLCPSLFRLNPMEENATVSFGFL